MTRPAPFARWLFCAALLALLALSFSSTARADRVALVVPGEPGVDVSGALVEAAAAGFTAAELGEPLADMEAAGEAFAKKRRALAAAVALGLDAARQQYLDQRFGEMIKSLAELRQSTLTLLAAPEQRATLWEVSFQRGLAFHARGRAGDAAAARREFALAVAVDPDRGPPRDVYGPDLNQAFTRALAASRSRVAKPFRVSANPADARIVIDGVPVVDGTGARTLLPGFHVVLAEAAGHEPVARVVDTASESSIELTLEPHDGDSTADALGAAWSRGLARPTTATASALWRALATRAGADVVVWVGAGNPVEVIVIDADGNTTRESSTSAALATRAAFRAMARGNALPPAPGGGSSSRKWLIIGGVTALAVAVVVTGIALSAGGDSGNADGDRIEVGVVP